MKYVILIPLLLNQIIAAGETTRSETDSIPVIIVQEAWHTGIILPVAPIKYEIWPEAAFFKGKKHVDVSWGDEKFYQAPGSPVLLATRAILWPTQSVMRIYPFSVSISSAYTSEARFLVIKLSRQQFDRLTQFFASSLINSSLKYNIKY